MKLSRKVWLGIACVVVGACGGAAGAGEDASPHLAGQALGVATDSGGLDVDATAVDAEVSDADVALAKCITASDCDDGNECTLDTCDPYAGCQHQGGPTDCYSALLASAFSPTSGAGALAPTSPPVVTWPAFAAPSAAATCLASDPDGPPPPGDVDVGSGCDPAGSGQVGVG